MKDMYTDPPDGEVAADGRIEKSETYDHLIAEPPRSGNPTPKLAWGPILDRGEEADLIRRAQAGNKPALTTLLQKFHRAIRKVATRYVPDPKIERQAAAWGLPTHDGPELEDLVAAGMAELTKAILRFNPHRNNGLYAYAKKYIEGAISAEAKNYKKRGTGGETRIERWVYSHPYDTPEKVAYELSKRGIRCTPEQAAQAGQSVSARRGDEHYSTTDAEYEEGDRGEKFIGARPAAQHDVYEMYACYGSNPHLRFHNAASRLIDDLVADADKRAERRLKEIGRRAYALELVAKDHARIAARADQQQYLYPWKRPKSVATTKPRKRKSHSRQPRKRYWRSWEENAAVAA